MGSNHRHGQSVQSGPSTRSYLNFALHQHTAHGLATSGICLALPAFGWLLEVLVLPQIGEDTGLLTLFLEAAERALERLVVLNSYAQHAIGPPERRNATARQKRESVAQEEYIGCGPSPPNPTHHGG